MYWFFALVVPGWKEEPYTPPEEGDFIVTAQKADASLPGERLTDEYLDTVVVRGYEGPGDITPSRIIFWDEGGDEGGNRAFMGDMVIITSFP